LEVISHDAVHVAHLDDGGRRPPLPHGAVEWLEPMARTGEGYWSGFFRDVHHIPAPNSLPTTTLRVRDDISETNSSPLCPA